MKTRGMCCFGGHLWSKTDVREMHLCTDMCICTRFLVQLTLMSYSVLKWEGKASWVLIQARSSNERLGGSQG